MRTRSALATAVLVALSLSACQDDTDDVPPSTERTPSAEQLPIGKSVVPLSTGRAYGSPEGFSPGVIVTVGADGWVSTHRSADAFDVSQPVPDADAALVVLAFLVPPEATGAEALASVEAQARAAGALVEQSDDHTLAVTGGQGPLVSSRDGNIALDAMPTGYARITADVGDSPMLRVWWVPDAAYQDDAEGLGKTLDVVVTSGPP